MLTIYKASAGSGKTFQLALHYLKMVLGVKERGVQKWKLNPLLKTHIPSQAHRHILAITFTNKATEEMKTRIITSLYRVASAETPEDHEYIKPLMETFGCSFVALRDAARQAMTAILHDFSFFNVSTIDSFFQTVLRTFARELGIQGDYNIEINASDVIARAINELLGDLSLRSNAKDDDKTMERVSKWLRDKIRQKDKKYNPFKRNSRDFKDLVILVKKIFSEDFKHLQDQLFKYFEDPSNLERFGEALDNEESRLSDELKDAGNKAETAIKLSGQYDFAKTNTIKMVNSLIEGTVCFKSPSTMIMRMIEGVKGNEYTLNKKQLPNEAYVAAMDTLGQDLRRLYAKSKTITLLKSKIPHLEFISLVLRYLDRVRESDNMLILDDTSTYIAKIIGGSEIPFIYEHLGSQLRHFLIDEFQDTSRLQWKNLLPLVQNSHSNDDDCLIIGDVKQAIYRFRNSDASILGHDLEYIDFPDEDNRIIRGITEAENCNYRTAHGIVRFNNTIMPMLASLALDMETPEGYIDSQVIQMYSPQRANLSGEIRLFPYDYSIGKKESADIQYDLFGDMLLQPVIPDEDTKIKLLVEQIRIQSKKYSLKDIAILFRVKAHAEPVIKALLEGGFNVQSAESLFLKNAPSIRLLVSLLNMLVTAGHNSKSTEQTTLSETKPNPESHDLGPMDPVLFESRYNFFLYHGGINGSAITPQQAIEKALNPTATATVSYQEEDLIDPHIKHEVPKSLEEVIRTILHKHPATLVAVIEAILSSGLIPQSYIKNEKDYIAAFTDLAMEYSETRDNDLVGFLEWWAQQQDSASVTPPPDSDAIQVLTIHRAKGLEYKCVHLIDFDWKLVDDRESIWLDLRANANEQNINIGLDIDPDVMPPLMCIDTNDTEMGYEGSPFADLLRKQQFLMRFDALNNAYVGLTRAKNSLSVYFGVNTNNKENTAASKPATIGEALAIVMDSKAGVSRNDNPYCMEIPAENYNPDTKAFTIDVPPTAIPTEKEENTKTASAEYAIKDSNRKEAVAMAADYISTFRTDMCSVVNVEALERDPDKQIRDIEDEDTSELTKEETVERRKKQIMEQTQRGLDLHEILSHIPYVEANDYESAFDRAFQLATHTEGFCTDNEEEYRAIVTDMVSRPETSKWFDKANRTETEMIYHLPIKDITDYNRLSIIKRIDRMVELLDGTIEIIDYKFSKDKESEYSSQVRTYMRDMTKIFPDRKIRGYLWYYDLDCIETITL